LPPGREKRNIALAVSIDTADGSKAKLSERSLDGTFTVYLSIYVEYLRYPKHVSISLGFQSVRTMSEFPRAHGKIRVAQIALSSSTVP
jgi:hypothetical protein